MISGMVGPSMDMLAHTLERAALQSAALAEAERKAREKPRIRVPAYRYPISKGQMLPNWTHIWWQLKAAGLV